jgi:phage-related holin
MKKVIDYVVSNFGFKDITDFSNSLVHKNIMLLSIPVAGISSILETLFGLQGITILAFVILVMLELITGLIASKVRGEAIVSNKFGRFGLKVFVWLTLLFVLNALKNEYRDDGVFDGMASMLFTWLHGTLFIYINLEYLISILENLGVITGKNNDSIIKLIRDKFKGLFK